MKKKPPKIIKPHENSREEHVCNEHFCVLNFLYLRSQSVRCATCAIHSFPYAAIAFIFVNLLHYDDKNLALIDSNNFTLLCSIPYCSAKRTPKKDKENNLFALCYRLVAENFCEPNVSVKLHHLNSQQTLNGFHAFHCFSSL